MIKTFWSNIYRNLQSPKEEKNNIIRTEWEKSIQCIKGKTVYTEFQNFWPVYCKVFAVNSGVDVMFE